MTKALKTLIKLHKRTLDELRRKITSLERQKEQLLEASAKLEEELQFEIDLGTQQPEMAPFFGDFAKRIKARQEKLAEEVLLINEQIEKLKAEMTVAFGELKKFEIAKTNADKRAAKEAAHKETIALDEMAGQQHRRKHEDSGAA